MQLMGFAFFQYFGAALTVLFLKAFTRLEIHGRENLAELNKPLIVVANHESHLDPQLVGVALWARPGLLPLRFMAKNELFRIPGLNILMWAMGAFRAHKKRGIEVSLSHPLKILKGGGAVIMFPEGRVIPERPKLGEGRRGAAMLALMTGATLLPVSVHTPHDLPPVIPFTVDRPRVVIRIGEPFFLNNVDYPDLSDENTYKATQKIMEQIGKLYYQHQY
jgi:1-acyl-sn-glycerol-3-phosphate acyltransferase